MTTPRPRRGQRRTPCMTCCGICCSWTLALTCRMSIDYYRKSMEGWAMGKLAVRALRAVLVIVLAGTVFVQALLALALTTDPEDGSLPLTPLRMITILGMV